MAAIACVVIAVMLTHSARLEEDTLIMAHRGAALHAPENTLASVHRAISDSTDCIEIDVQETADGEVVVLHDSDFMKLAGVDRKVWDATLAQLRDIDVGSWFGSEFSGERVPTLLEVLEEARGESGVVIELKYYGHDQQLEQRVVDIVEQTEMADDVAIMSLKYDGIQKIRALRQNWTIGLLSAKAIGNLAELDVDFLAVNMSMAEPRLIRRAHASGKRVFVWTVNDPVSMSRMMSLGVDGIITDEPAMARAVLEIRSRDGSRAASVDRHRVGDRGVQHAGVVSAYGRGRRVGSEIAQTAVAAADRAQTRYIPSSTITALNQLSNR